jgi:phosphoglucomutase
MNHALNQFNRWLNHSEIDASSKKKLLQYSEDERDDAFFKDIEFGTAGMRGIMGLGTNRINSFTIKKAVVAYGQYLLNTFPDHLDKGVVIAHDNRHGAIEFTNICVHVLNQMGISTYTFDELVPTPMLSYTVRHLSAIGGIMLTASHNPKEHNGFKVYDEFGCQLVPQKIDRVVHILSTLGDFLSVKTPVATIKGKKYKVSKEVEKAYLTKILALQLQPNLKKDNFRVVFTPQHGASYRLVPLLFHQMGYQLHQVKEQSTVDPDFSGTLSPNPEEPASYIQAIHLAKQVDAHLVMVADPDADRVGLAYKDKHGNYPLLNGNLSAALLIHYLLTVKKSQNMLPVNGVVYDTIVSSPLAKKIALSFGIRVESFLTGFKFIGERIQFYKEHAGPSFVFGYEESYGCLIGDFVRDKDALQALTMYAEMTLHYVHLGKTLDVILDEIYQTYGYHVDRQYSLALKGIEGQQLLDSILSSLRLTPFKSIGQQTVVKFEDYLTQISKTDSEVLPIALPKANVIKFYLGNGSTIVVRPSGTEPKCKFYLSVVSKTKIDSNKELESLKVAFFDAYAIKEV